MKEAKIGAIESPEDRERETQHRHPWVRVRSLTVAMVNVSKMNKKEATDYLQSLGEVPNPKWTVCEIKSKIMQILGEGKDTARLGASTENSKEELQQLCRDKGIAFTKNNTKGDLLRKLRDYQTMTAETIGETLVGFGKHKDRKLKDVPEDYITWARETFRDDPEAANPLLRRLVEWSEQDKKERELEKEPTGTTSRTPTSPRASASAASSLTAPSSTANLENMITQILGGMQNLQTRLADLEEQKEKKEETKDGEKESESSFKMVFP